MVNELWGVAGRPGLVWPDNLPAVVISLLAAGALALLFHRTGSAAALKGMARPQWALFIALCGASLLLSQLFPLAIPWSNPLLAAHPAASAVTLLAAAPYLLAGVALGAPAAIVVGLFAGAGRMLGQTGAPLDVVALGLAAGVSALVMRQNYAGRLFDLLRQPIIAGGLGRLVVAVCTALAVFSQTSGAAGFFGALDLALYVGLWSALPLVIEGAIGGCVASAVLWIAPQWRPERGVVPSPLQRSLQRQLVAAFLTFAAVVVLLSAAVAFHFSARSTERALTEQMLDGAGATAVRLDGLQVELTGMLNQYGQDPALADANPAAKSAALGRMQTPRLFERVWLVGQSGAVTAGPGGATDLAVMSAVESAAVDQALASGGSRWIAGEAAGDEPIISLAVGGTTAGGERAALLARVAPEAIAAIAAGLPDAGGAERQLIVDENWRVLLASGNEAGSVWSPPAAEQLALSLTRQMGWDVYETVDPVTGERLLVSITPVAQSGWKVITATTRAAILSRTMGIIGPLSLLLLVVSTLFYALIATLGRDITQPIAEMGRASRAIAEGGGLERPIRANREDEIGQLGNAFSQMQRALRSRLDELSLLLSVSNEVAATINIDKGMAAVLQGVLRGTGAAGARAIVRNPNAPAPLLFAEGPAADELMPLDRAVLLRLRSVDELAYATAAEMEEGLGVAPSPAAALFALPLRPAGEFQGVLYVAYRKPHYFDSNERNLLRTLAGQATVLVQNAHLFVAAEGGRRRLAAILASTTHGVIVTDQTDRVLLLNPAMERAFGLRAREVAGRPVVDALAHADQSGVLARRLSLGYSSAAGGTADGKVEVEANGRAFLAGIATVYSNEGLTMGRVAVLQDVTDIKELDRMKSDFIAGISHDLLSPLTYMHNYASMLPLVDDPALEQEYAGKILGGIDRMKRLVNDLLDLARIEAGLNLQFDRVHIGELLNEVAAEYASPAHERGVKLVVAAPAGLPPATADPALLRRAVTNLVTNGIKHAPNSGELTLRAEKVGGELVISVRDRGPGIAPADQSHLFQKFYRGQGTTTAERAGGSGLGLAIVKSVADHHDGRVWCESAPGEGATFYLGLPINRQTGAVMSLLGD